MEATQAGEPPGPALYTQAPTYVYPGYMFGPPMYNVNGKYKHYNLFISYLPDFLRQWGTNCVKRMIYTYFNYLRGSCLYS